MAPHLGHLSHIVAFHGNHDDRIKELRYLGGDPEELLAAVSGTVEKPFSIAGSVNSFERIDYLKTLPMLGAFTIGGAFFENKFGGSFAEQIDKVCAYLKN